MPSRIIGFDLKDQSLKKVEATMNISESVDTFAARNSAGLLLRLSAALSLKRLTMTGV
jgi:hypothetical protein